MPLAFINAHLDSCVERRASPVQRKPTSRSRTQEHVPSTLSTLDDAAADVASTAQSLASTSQRRTPPLPTLAPLLDWQTAVDETRHVVCMQESPYAVNQRASASVAEASALSFTVDIQFERAAKGLWSVHNWHSPSQHFTFVEDSRLDGMLFLGTGEATSRLHSCR